VIYSVWNQGAGTFDYYETTEQQNMLNVERPTHIQSRTLGSTVTQAAWPLPASARKVGQGPIPRGKIAARKSAAALGEVTTGSSVTKAALVGFGALAACLVLGRRQR